MLPTGSVKVRDLQWVGDHHLIVIKSTTATVDGVIGPRNEYFLAVDVNLATGNSQPLLNGVGDGKTETMNIIGALPEARTIKGRPIAFLVGTAFANMRGVYALFRVDLDSRTTRLVAQGNPDTEDWLLDADGEIAARVDYAQRSGRWTLWTRRGDRLVKSMDETRLLDPPQLRGFGRSADTVMIEMPDGDARSYREVALGDDAPSAPVAALAGAGLIVDPVTHLVIGSSRDDGMAVDYRFLAEPDQRLWQAVQRAFPNAVVSVESWSDDRRMLVLRVEGAAAGAGYYVLDTAAHKAGWLADEYAGLAPDDLGKVSTITYKAADGLAIPAFLTLPPERRKRPACRSSSCRTAAPASTTRPGSTGGRRRSPRAAPPSFSPNIAGRRATAKPSTRPATANGAARCRPICPTASPSSPPTGRSTPNACASSAAATAAMPHWPGSACSTAFIAAPSASPARPICA